MSQDPQAYRSDVLRRLTEETDVFGHEDYAASLCSAVQKVKPPFTLGLLAPWGTGKSSILETAVERLNDEDADVAAVVFDVWKFEGNSLRREFVRELGERLKEQGQLKRSFSLKDHLETLDADIVHFKTRLRPSVAHALRAGILALLAGVALYLLLSGSDHQALQTFGGVILAFILGMLGQAVRVEEIQVTQNRLQDPDEFARSFEGLLRKGLKAKRLVIGIDNLDRCSPERVTELLGTIKTFLEPAKAGKELVFVLAADDVALKRHLIAQELAASGGPEAAQDTAQRSPPRDDDGEQGGGARSRDQETEAEPGRVPNEVRDAVDEYLRKFFTGVLRVSDLLEGDVREFTRQELEDFVALHIDDPDTGRQLTELIALALKQNPRRIMQFINGLELRLELLNQRQRSGRIQMDEPDVLVVAKLAIIEEQFSDRFRELKEDPTKLRDWHAEVREQASQGRTRQDHAWTTFLHYSARIEADDLRPYLTLQQSEVERRLPQYRRFAGLLESGDAGSVDEFLSEDDVSPHATEYRNEVRDLMWANIKGGFTTGAVNVVRSSIESEALEPVASDVLRQALGIPDLREPLADISARSLLDRARHLAPHEFNAVAAVALARFGGDDDGASERRAGLSEVLVDYLDRLDTHNETRIRNTLRSEAVRGDFDSFLVLAEAAPGLLPSEVIETGLGDLGRSSPWTVELPAYRVVRAALGIAEPEAADASHIAQFSEVVTGSLVQLKDSDHDAFQELATDGARILRRFVGLGIDLDPSADRFETEWSAVPVELHPPAMEFMTALLTAGTPTKRDQFAVPWIDRFFNESAPAALDWVAQGYPRMGQDVVNHVNTKLALYASGEDSTKGVADQAVDVVLALDAERRRGLLTSAVDSGIERGRYARAARLLETHRDDLRDAREERVNRLLDLAQSGEASNASEALLAVAVFDPSQLSSQQRERQADVVARGAVDVTDDWQTAYRDLKQANSPDLAQILTKLFDHVAGQAPTIENHLAQVEFLAAEQDRLSRPQLRQFGRLINESIQRIAATPSARQWIPQLAAAIGNLSDATTDDRRDWVTDLIQRERERSPREIQVRESLLRAADSLAGPHGSARREVNSRLKQLSNSDDQHDKALAEGLESGA